MLKKPKKVKPSGEHRTFSVEEKNKILEQLKRFGAMELEKILGTMK